LRGFYRLYRAVRRINSVCVGASCVMIALIAVLTVWEAITRYFFRQPATWTYPVTSYLLLYSIYLAVAYTLQRGGHVSVDFVLELLSGPPRRWLQRLGHALGLAFTLVLLYQSQRLFVRHATEGQRDISSLSLPLAPISAMLVMGLILMALTYILVLIDSFLCPASELTLQERELAAGSGAIQLD
jgi:TRAP-type C4-dicarboxylate transport system permease small subunit